MGRARWRRRGEYKRGDIHQDDRCSAEIDSETKPRVVAMAPSTRASAPIDR